MQTRKLQILDSLIKQAENADTLDGKHADEFASASDVADLQIKVGDKTVSEQIEEAIAEIEPAITEEEIPNLYVWKKYSCTEGSVSNVTIGSGTSLTYYTKIIINDGKIDVHFNDMQGVNSRYFDINIFYNARGNYVQIADTIYYIPENATITGNSSAVKASSAINLTTSLNYLGYVSSKSSSTYPTDTGIHTDGYLYEYIKQVGDGDTVESVNGKIGAVQLIASDVGAVAEEEVPNLYVWKKYDSDPKNVKQTDVSSAQISWRLEGYSTGFSVRNSDSISIDGGSISLVDEITSVITADNTDSLLGKYIYSSGSISTGDSNEGYYFIPTNATFTVGTSELYAKNIKKLSMPTCLGYAASKSFNAYASDTQHIDGHWYQYIKQMGDSAVVDGSSVNFTETDPTVPAWAKAATKPTYTASEVGALPATTKYAGSSSVGGAATSANKLNTNAGSATQPVYFENGVPVATTHTLGASVPSDAKFTDTIYLHPIYSPAKENGFYKVTVDDEGHVSNTVAVTKNDITALGLTASDIGALPALTAIPDALSDLAEDATHRTVTDTEKSTWNAKANASDIPTVPTKVSEFTNDAGYLTEHQSLSGYAKTSDIPTNVSQLTNDKGYITGYTETDPTVPAWAKAANKPSYTASEVGALPNTTKIPSKTSDLTNDSGFITGYTETDPTVPSWAKAENKPSYTKSEVGLGNVENVKQYSANNPPPYPVTKVNGQTGDIALDAAAVGARPDAWMPTASDVGADASGTASTAVTAHNESTNAHADIRTLINNLDSNKLNTTALNSAINTALTQAKNNGDFNGKNGLGIFITNEYDFREEEDGIYEFNVSDIDIPDGYIINIGDLIYAPSEYNIYRVENLDDSYGYMSFISNIRGLQGEAGKSIQGEEGLSIYYANLKPTSNPDTERLEFVESYIVHENRLLKNGDLIYCKADSNIYVIDAVISAQSITVHAIGNIKGKDGNNGEPGLSIYTTSYNVLMNPDGELELDSIYINNPDSRSFQIGDIIFSTVNKTFYLVKDNSNVLTLFLDFLCSIESECPTKVSDLTNDVGYITIKDIPEVDTPDLSGYALKSSAETWTFTLSDGSKVTKKVVLA